MKKLNKEKVRETIVQIADCILEKNMIVSDVSKKFGMTQGAVLYHIHKTLRDVNPNKYELVRNALHSHLGGKTTYAKTWTRYTQNAKYKDGYYFVRDSRDTVEICYYDGKDFVSHCYGVIREDVVWLMNAERTMKRWRML